ncbi:MAG: rod shape-determining protein MreC [Planctomycetaceae bacterium]
MSTHTPHRSLWLGTGVMLVLLGAVWLADRANLLTSARMTLHNVLSPGRLLVAAWSSPDAGRFAEVATPSGAEVAELQNALLQNELQRRQLLIQNARLHNELRLARQFSSVATVTGHDLVDFVAVQARVLSRDGLPDSLTAAFIDAGKTQGLQRSQLVVNGSGLVVDKGRDHGVAADQKVAHGTAVVGRIAQVSQWVALVQPVTDTDFSAAVQIVKMAPEAASFGAKGLLEGTGGDTCRVTGIPYTAAVAVGDEVFSADLDGVHGPRLYYGTVTRAEFSAGGQWDIQVTPALQSDDLSEVAVVMQRLSGQRVTQSRTDTN